jgi:hypothetical protein
MNPTARIDQAEAACNEVIRMAQSLRSDLPPNTYVAHDPDPGIREILWKRLGYETGNHLIEGCCPLVQSPRPLYWLPRRQIMLCQHHWDRSLPCPHFSECDVCRQPTAEAFCVYTFMGMYIVEAYLCLRCSDRLRLSPSTG